MQEYRKKLRECNECKGQRTIQRRQPAPRPRSRPGLGATWTLAIDALLQSRNLDRIILRSGDGDYERLIEAPQHRGCRMEVIGSSDVSSRLVKVADNYISGCLIPGLLPLE